jgi:iron complex transport system ATP-binding protein
MRSVSITGLDFRDLMSDALVFDDVEVRVAGAGRILGPLSLRVGTGERWVILGPNGSGKTTLLSVAGAWRQPSSGRATVLGARLGRVDVRDLRMRIGHVGHTVNDRFRAGQLVRDVVRTGRSSTLETWFQDFTTGEDAEVEARLDQVGCLPLADRPLATCSQGERARVMLARAMFGRRELLLFDEPAAGLDLPGRERLIVAMESAGAGGITSVLATHHLEEIPPSTTHAGVLRAGAILAHGPIDAVLTDGGLSEVFAMGVKVARRGGRWTAFAG